MLPVVSLINVLANFTTIEIIASGSFGCCCSSEPKTSHHRLDAEHADLFLRYQIRGLASRSSCSSVESIRALNASSASATIRDSLFA